MTLRIACVLGAALFLPSGATFLSGCGANPTKKVEASSPESSPAPPRESVPMAITELRRQEVVDAVNEGLGRFLQKVEVRAEFRDEVFVGFRIVRFANPRAFAGVGLLPGDVVRRVNGSSIEREGQAFEVFQSLKTASHLEIDYLRQGAEMALSLPIVGEVEASEVAPSAGTGGSSPTLSTAR